MSKSKTKIKEEFLFHLELFYRNFGNEWSIDDFPESIKKHKDYLHTYLKYLEQSGVISLDEEKQKFIILKLPSESNLL